MQFAAARLQGPEGLIHAVATPFADDGEVDFDAFERLITFQIKRGGASALSPLLHFGESPSLSIQERRQLAEIAVGAAGDRAAIYVHVTAPTTDMQLSLARHAEQVGCGGIVTAQPYYANLSATERLAHFDAVSAATSLPTILYNSPGAAGGADLPPNMIGYIAASHTNVVGIKDAKFDSSYCTEIQMHPLCLGKQFSYMCGIDYVLPTVALGATACFSVAACIAPHLAHDLWRSCRSGDTTGAAASQGRMTELLQVLLPKYPSSFKAAMQIMGRPVGAARLPVPALTPKEVCSLESALDALGITDEEPAGW